VGFIPFAEDGVDAIVTQYVNKCNELRDVDWGCHLFKTLKTINCDKYAFLVADAPEELSILKVYMALCFIALDCPITCSDDLDDHFNKQLKMFMLYGKITFRMLRT